jgi:uncharacterized protein YjiS (DUF1127 family)
MTQSLLSMTSYGVAHQSSNWIGMNWRGFALVRRYASRWNIAELSDRQIRDAGIDLGTAGRGKACAVDPQVLPNLGSLR